jgi:hypothetical protein
MLELRVYDPPTLLSGVPHLSDLMVILIAREKVRREPHPGPGWDAKRASHREKDHRKIPTASNQPITWASSLDERPIIQVSDPGQHLLGVPTVNLCKALLRDAQGKRIIESKVDHQAIRGTLQLSDLRRKARQHSSLLSGIRQTALSSEIFQSIKVSGCTAHKSSS